MFSSYIYCTFIHHLSSYKTLSVNDVAKIWCEVQYCGQNDVKFLQTHRIILSIVRFNIFHISLFSDNRPLMVLIIIDILYQEHLYMGLCNGNSRIWYCWKCDIAATWIYHRPGVQRIKYGHGLVVLGFVVNTYNIPDSKVPGGQHGAHLGPVGPRWTPCWPQELWYQGYLNILVASHHIFTNIR